MDVLRRSRIPPGLYCIKKNIFCGLKVSGDAHDMMHPCASEYCGVLRQFSLS